MYKRKISALVGALALSISACSSIGSSSFVYDFTPDPTAQNPSKLGETHEVITVKVPEGLIEASGTRREDMLFESVTISAHKLKSSKKCAVDFTPSYNDGMFERSDIDEKLKHAGVPSDAKPISELNESDPEKGPYISEDGATWTRIVTCAPDPLDRSYRTGISVAGLASVDVVAMKNGTVAIAESEVKGYILDSNGDWIKG